jgi:hypothetical protein
VSVSSAADRAGSCGAAESTTTPTAFAPATRGGKLAPAGSPTAARSPSAGSRAGGDASGAEELGARRCHRCNGMLVTCPLPVCSGWCTLPVHGLCHRARTKSTPLRPSRTPRGANSTEPCRQHERPPVRRPRLGARRQPVRRAACGARGSARVRADGAPPEERDAARARGARDRGEHRVAPAVVGVEQPARRVSSALQRGRRSADVVRRGGCCAGGLGGVDYYFLFPQPRSDHAVDKSLACQVATAAQTLAHRSSLNPPSRLCRTYCPPLAMTVLSHEPSARMKDRKQQQLFCVRKLPTVPSACKDKELKRRMSRLLQPNANLDVCSAPSWQRGSDVQRRWTRAFGCRYLLVQGCSMLGLRSRSGAYSWQSALTKDAISHRVSTTATAPTPVSAEVASEQHENVLSARSETASVSLFWSIEGHTRATTFRSFSKQGATMHTTAFSNGCQVSR